MSSNLYMADEEAEGWRGTWLLKVAQLVNSRTRIWGQVRPRSESDTWPLYCMYAIGLLPFSEETRPVYEKLISNNAEECLGLAGRKTGWLVREGLGLLGLAGWGWLSHLFKGWVFSQPDPAGVKFLGRERGMDSSDREGGRRDAAVCLTGASGERADWRRASWKTLERVSGSIRVLTPSFGSHLLSSYYVQGAVIDNGGQSPTLFLLSWNLVLRERQISVQKTPINVIIHWDRCFHGKEHMAFWDLAEARESEDFHKGAMPELRSGLLLPQHRVAIACLLLWLGGKLLERRDRVCHGTVYPPPQKYLAHSRCSVTFMCTCVQIYKGTRM